MQMHCSKPFHVICGIDGSVGEESVRVGRGALWSVINSGLAQVLSLAAFFVTARFVSPSDFGVMAICLLIVELFRQTAVEGIAIAVTAQEAPLPEDFNACFISITLTSAASALLALALADVIAAFMANDQIGPALRLVSLLLLTTGLARTHEAWLTRQLQFRSLALRSVLSIAGGGGLGVVLAIRGYGLMALIAQQLATAVIATVALWLASSWRPSLRTNRESFVKLWKSGRHISLTGLTNFVNTQSDTFFASYYLGATATGMYNAAKRILLGANIVLVSALNRVALPAFANLRGDPERLSNAFLRATSITSTITAPVFFGLIVVAPDVVAVALGPRWVGAGSVLSLIAVTAYLTSLGQYNQSVLLVRDKAHWQTLLTAVYAITNVFLFLIVVRYGLEALAIGFTARAVLLYPLSAGAALFLLDLDARAYFRRVMPTVLAAGLMSAATWLFRMVIDVDHTLLRLILSVGFGAFAYISLLLVLARRDWRDAVFFARGLIGR